MNTQVLPERPDVQEHETVQAPPKKRHGWLIALGVAGALVVAGGVGSVASNLGEKAAPIAGSVIEAPQAPVESGPTADDVAGAADQTVTLIDSATTELDAVVAATEVGDVSGAALHLDNAGGYWDDISAVWNGIDPYLSDTAGQVASYLYSAADNLTAGNYNAAVSDIESGTALVGDMTSYLEGSEVGGIAV